MQTALALQGVAMLVAGLLVWRWQGLSVTAAFEYGGVVSLANSGLLVWRWHRGLKDFHCDGGRHLKSFHRSSLERFFVVAVLLAAGMAGGKLEPLAVLIGFSLGQLLWVILTAVLKCK